MTFLLRIVLKVVISLLLLVVLLLLFVFLLVLVLLLAAVAFMVWAATTETKPRSAVLSVALKPKYRCSISEHLCRLLQP